MEVITQEVTKADLLNSEYIFDGPMVKAVVDINKRVIAVDAELHADLEKLLLESGSNQDDLWGINLYPEEETDFVEFDSMINVRPRQGNRSRAVENPDVQKNILEVVRRWIR